MEWHCGGATFNYEGGPIRGDVEIVSKKTGDKVTVRMVDLLRFIGLRVRDQRVEAL